MTPNDLVIRNATYRLFVELGRAPEPGDVAVANGIEPADVAAAWLRLAGEHALVLDGAGRLVMANPFSGVETPHVVEALGRRWFANCGWDAFGIGVVLRTDSTIHTVCPDCDEKMDLDVRNYRSADASPVFHVLVPARDWWSDIGFT